MAALRLVVGLAGVVIAVVPPTPPSRYPSLTWMLLGAYAVYGLLLYALFFTQGRQPAALQRIEPAIDLLWAGAVMASDHGVDSDFFLLLPLTILMAGLRWGRPAGVRVAVTATAAFAAAGLYEWNSEQHQQALFFIRTVLLLLLGYIMATWGGAWVALQRRLALLKEVTTLSNPRFGVNHTFGMIVARLGAFYEADLCLLVLSDPAAGEHQLLSARWPAAGEPPASRLLPPEMARLLTAFPANQMLVYSAQAPWRGGGLAPRCAGYDLAGGKRITGDRATAELLAAALDAPAFVTVPLRYRAGVGGRLYLAAHTRAFDLADADFLLQVLEHAALLLDNIRLVDQLASRAAEDERQRIARDIHDSVIQPYIGLQMGLAAVRSKLASGRDSIAADIDQLIDLSGAGTAELRRYVRRLKDGGERETSLVQATRRFAATFSEATGIAVDVDAETEIPLNDRLAAEVFQMVAEGLSNIRRHTQAGQAAVAFAYRTGTLVLRICNEGTPGVESPPFRPRSISERAEALGGSAHVEAWQAGGAAVVVEIPL